MTAESSRSGRLVRIELATSEVEGGACCAWADPAQVLAVLAVSSPEGAFARSVEPRLAELEGAGRLLDGSSGRFREIWDPGPGDSAALPLGVRCLISKIQALHAGLHRENREHPEIRDEVRLSCVLVEDDRAWFVKTSPVWICVLRDGRARPVEGLPAGRIGDSAWLGRGEDLDLEVTSLPVEAGDVLVLLTSDGGVAPETRAVAHLFSQMTDLKRACDGLVNLTGIETTSASAIALRFSPIAALDNEPENPLAGLEGIDPAGQAADADSMIEAALDQVFQSGSPSEAGPGRMPLSPPSPMPETEALRIDPVGESDQARESADAGEDDEIPPAGKGQRLRWAIAVNLLVLAGVLLVALPRSPLRLQVPPGWFHRGAAGPSVLEVAPEPPVKRVLLDGEEGSGPSPVQFDAVSPGQHRVTLDLGPCGLMEMQVEVSGQGPTRFAPLLEGTVEVTAEDAGAGGRVWVTGRDKLDVPATLDSLPAGWNRIFFENPRIGPWDRLVLVRPGATTRVVIPSDPSPDWSRVRVESLRWKERSGLIESEGDSVWIDGKLAGTTPYEALATPGIHAVRVGSEHGWNEVVEARAGMVREVEARLGERLPSIRHVAPGRILVRGPVLLSVEISPLAGADSGSGAQPILHLADVPGGAEEIPLSPVNRGDGAFVAVVDADQLPIGRSIPYYFTTTAGDGATIWSDLYEMTLTRHWGSSGGGGSSPETAPLPPS